MPLACQLRLGSLSGRWSIITKGFACLLVRMIFFGLLCDMKKFLLRGRNRRAYGIILKTTRLYGDSDRLRMTCQSLKPQTFPRFFEPPERVAFSFPFLLNVTKSCNTSVNNRCMKGGLFATNCRVIPVDNTNYG